MTDIYRGPIDLPDPDFVPGLADIPRSRLPRELGRRRSRRAEAAMLRVEAAAARVATRPLPPLVSVAVDDVPHVRLGLAWAGLTTGAAVAGRGVLAPWLAAAAAVAAAQVARARRREGPRPAPGVAAIAAAGLPLAAIAGADVLTGAVVGAVLLVLAAGLVQAAAGGRGRPVGDIGFTLLAALPVGLAAAGPVLVRGLGLTETLVLLAFVWAYDAGAFIVGTGAGSEWEGPVAGTICILPVTLVVAAVLVHPFDGVSAWLLGALAAAAAPFGQAVAGIIAGDSRGNVSALRRLDSLLIAGPLWAWAAALLLR